MRMISDGTGPFTVSHAFDAGFSRTDVRTMVRSGRWVRLRNGVFVTAADRTAAAALDATLHAQDVQALRLAMSRRRLVAAGTSAARIFGVDLRRDPGTDLVLLTDDAGVSGTHRDGYFLRTAPLPDDQVMTRHGVPVTAPARTLLDVAARRGFDDGVVAVESAFRRGLLTRDQFAAAVDAVERRPGILVARDVLAFADDKTESVLESVSRLTMRAIGIPMPQTQVVLVDDGFLFIRVDFYWPRYRLVGEADGMAKYSLGGREPLQVLRAERGREQNIRDLDIDIVRWDWHTAIDPHRLAARLQPAFARAEARLGGRAG